MYIMREVPIAFQGVFVALKCFFSKMIVFVITLRLFGFKKFNGCFELWNLFLFSVMLLIAASSIPGGYYSAPKFFSIQRI